MCAASIATRTSRIPIIPEPCSSSGRAPASNACYRSSWRSRARRRRTTRGSWPGASTRAGMSARSSPWPRSTVSRPVAGPSTMRSSSTPSPANTSRICWRRGHARNPNRSVRCRGHGVAICWRSNCRSRIYPSMRSPNMSKDDQTGDDAPESDSLNKLLLRLQLPFMRAHYHELAQTAVEQGWGPLDYLQRLAEGEISRREDKSLTQRIRRARFPLTKTLDQFQWNWPKKINRPQIQNLFRLNFIEQKSNAIFLGGV